MGLQHGTSAGKFLGGIAIGLGVVLLAGALALLVILLVDGATGKVTGGALLLFGILVYSGIPAVLGLPLLLLGLRVRRRASHDPN
jgi:hypothetical protein